MVYDPNDIYGVLRTWELSYTDDQNWQMVEAKKRVEDAEAVGMPIPYWTIRMQGDRYEEVHHDLTDTSDVPADVRARYEPTFLQMPPREQYALLVEGMKRGWVRVVDRVVSEATNTPPIPPTPLFEIVTPYPPTWGETRALARMETLRRDGTRVVTLTGQITCASARLSAAICGGSEARAERIVRTYEVRPDGIPVRFIETFSDRTTRVITLDNIVVL